MSLSFYTVGHSTRSLDEFASLVGVASIELIADIRTVRRSRANPQYDQSTLPQSLAEFGLAYTAVPQLGGLRSRRKDVPPDVNGFWENSSFHNYADYALSAEFQVGIERLIGFGREKRTAIMCSEAVWWRCHRRIVADYLLARGEDVFHLMGDNRMEPAELTRGVRIALNGMLTYPPSRRSI